MKTRWTCSGPNVSLADGFHHVIESSSGIRLIATTQKSAEGIAKILNLLEEKAEFADQCMQDHFENAFIEATIHKQLVRAASAAVIAFGSETEGEAIDHLRGVLFGNVYSILNDQSVQKLQETNRQLVAENERRSAEIASLKLRLGDVLLDGSDPS